jgi:hypothetical protein
MFREPRREYAREAMRRGGEKQSAFRVFMTGTVYAAPRGMRFGSPRYEGGIADALSPRSHQMPA